MLRRRILSTRMTTITSVLLSSVTFICIHGIATSGPQLESDANPPPKPAEAAPTGVNTLASQIKELQKEVASLQSRLGAGPSPQIVAAGTATFRLKGEQDNATNVRVRVKADVAARLGDDYIVLLTNRYPTGGFPFFAAYWKRAKDGFDITLVDDDLAPNSTSSYLYNKNKTYFIDWIVVKK